MPFLRRGLWVGGARELLLLLLEPCQATHTSQDRRDGAERLCGLETTVPAEVTLGGLQQPAVSR